MIFLSTNSPKTILRAYCEFLIQNNGMLSFFLSKILLMKQDLRNILILSVDLGVFVSFRFNNDLNGEYTHVTFDFIQQTWRFSANVCSKNAPMGVLRKNFDFIQQNKCFFMIFLPQILRRLYLEHIVDFFIQNNGMLSFFPPKFSQKYSIIVREI